MTDNKVLESCAAASTDDQPASYDAWAEKYEQDLSAMGDRLPALAAGVFARFVPPGHSADPGRGLRRRPRRCKAGLCLAAPGV